jgi:hypothetical protein
MQNIRVLIIPLVALSFSSLITVEDSSTTVDPSSSIFISFTSLFKKV